ncbi:hypothetical protein RFI_25039 [Reticulomyxa filosa]|uniref:Uncharacterized protein n=1 Tax=Reticulomyxa filosa TaxID=46433 RepID=X6MFZ1_RETFI|nr:hypothetical protein RFI_25039 [Reticulomyxa filosa]|eukprot:ETO12337.1 hypothetical protein RFI_25039 [Reticulomyxa filosa]
MACSTSPTTAAIVPMMESIESTVVISGIDRMHSTLTPERQSHDTICRQSLLSKTSELSELDNDDLLAVFDHNSNGEDKSQPSSMNATKEEESDQSVHINIDTNATINVNVNVNTNANVNASDYKDLNAVQSRTSIEHKDWNTTMYEKQEKEALATTMTSQRATTTRMRRTIINDKNEDGPFDIEEVELSQEDVFTLTNDSQDNGDANMDEQHMSITTTTRKEEKQQQQRRQMRLPHSKQRRRWWARPNQHRQRWKITPATMTSPTSTTPKKES